MPIPGLPSAGLRTRLLLSLSAANLLLFRCWQALLPGSTDQYFGAWTPTLASISALLALMVITTIVIYAISWIIYDRLQPSGLVMTTLHVLALVVLQHPLREAITGSYSHLNLFILKSLVGRPAFYATALVLVAFAIHLVHTWPTQAERLGRSLLLLLLPLPLVCLGSILFHTRAGGGPIAQVTTFTPGGFPPARQLYLIVFDEWDYGWTFAHRPTDLSLPHLDAFAEESLQAHRAYPPASETKRSIPSILSGRLFSDVSTGPDGDLHFQDAESMERIRLSELEDLTLIASRRGDRVLMVDYYHAYGNRYQQLRQTLDLFRLPYYSEWARAAGSQGQFFAAIKFESSLAMASLPGLKGLQKDQEIPHLRTLHASLMNRLLDEASNPSHELVIVHLPVPHAPCLAPLPECKSRPGSIGNLTMVDEAIGALRSRLDQRGEWNNTTIILTSDHWQRTMTAEGMPLRPQAFSGPEFAHRIPLLIKFSGSSLGHHEATPLNNRIVHHLVKDWLFGHALTQQQVVRWAGKVPVQGVYDPLIK